MGDRQLLLKLFLTVWLVYAAHLTSNVTRETYLALALAERQTIRVDPYLGLHPDLFEIPGRGGFINSNPGASLLAAIPILVSRPLVEGLFAIRPGLARPKPPTSYNDPRPNRTVFMNEMRARGLDVRLALAAFASQLGLMAPLGALAAVILFGFLRAQLQDRRTALWLALTYAFVTPIFFRSAFLNQNVLLAHAVLFAWVLLAWPGGPDRRHCWAGAGALLGCGILLDYSAVPIALVFGAWAVVEGWHEGQLRGAARLGGACLLGATGPILVLWGYQWAAFGSPWYPAQRYMPPTTLSVRGWNGMTLPSLDLLWRNLFDLRYGLFSFCPLLLLGLAAPFKAPGRGAPSRTEATVAVAAFTTLLLFSSANQFANLQWNTGVRYLVPAVPLLFMLVVPALLLLPNWARWVALFPTAVISWAVSMAREDVPGSLTFLAAHGPTLPMLVVLQKTAAAYAPWLAGGLQPLGAVSVLAVLAVITLIWVGPAGAPPHDRP
jgi:hypothetical protein